VSTPLPEDDEAASAQVLAALAITEAPREVYRAEDTQLDIVFDARTLHVDTASGKVLEEGQEPRLFFRLANWLHLNRGKKAWTYFADGYAVFLLFLAISGLFMIPGRKGLFGRGAVIATLGAAVPVLYIVLSGATADTHSAARREHSERTECHAGRAGRSGDPRQARLFSRRHRCRDGPRQA
jgi:hypothetical protein